MQKQVPIWCEAFGMVPSMDVTADGVSRLIHFVDARLGQLRMSKEDAVRRGFPDPETLPKVRDAHGTPKVRTLLRIDRTLGWEPGSAAVVLLGGTPLSLTARLGPRTEAKQRAGQPLTAHAVIERLLTQLSDEIAQARQDLDVVDKRVRRLSGVHDRLVEEFRVDEHLIAEFAGLDDDLVAEPGR